MIFHALRIDIKQRAKMVTILGCVTTILGWSSYDSKDFRNPIYGSKEYYT